MKLKKYLNETSVTPTSIGVPIHQGTSGQDIDILFAGPYHPDFGEIGKLLKGQLIRKDELIKLSNDITPEIELLFKFMDIDYDFDEVGNPYIKNVNNLPIDESGFDLSDDFKEKYSNNSNEMKYIDIYKEI